MRNEILSAQKRILIKKIRYKQSCVIQLLVMGSIRETNLMRNSATALCKAACDFQIITAEQEEILLGWIYTWEG